MKLKPNIFTYLFLTVLLVFLANIPVKAFFANENMLNESRLTAPEPSPSSQSSEPSSNPESSSHEPSSVAPNSSEPKKEEPKSEAPKVVYSQSSKQSTSYTSSYKKSASSAQSSMVSQQSSEMSLPDVSDVDLSSPNMFDSIAATTSNNNFVFGIIAWICIGLGILIILFVLFSSTSIKNTPIIGKYYSGKKRKHGSHKKLLADKYYKSIKK